MSGTKAGGMKAAATNKAKYGKEFYARIGKKGGQNGHTGGFAANPALARVAGAKGGRISRRGPAKKLPNNTKINLNQTGVDFYVKNYTITPALLRFTPQIVL